VSSSWLQLSVRTDPAAFDAVSNFLIERGSPGVVIKKREVQAYFPRGCEAETIGRDVQRFLRGVNGLYTHGAEPRLHWKLVKDEDWNSSWRRFIKPQKVGRAFWVTPPWLAPPKFRRRQVITIEPGMAFGTGAHATTRGCLEFIERAVTALGGARFSALDVGSGSGILAIALAKLGAKRVWAVDNDPVALRVARENLRRNGVQQNVYLSRKELSRIRGSFPVVVANLTAQTILDLATALEKKVTPKGLLILSGILRKKADDVRLCFASACFRVVARKREKEWVTLLLKRN
jgi:ribosomal protein L11 methyltransferase